jgi:hypothetical protein
MSSAAVTERRGISFAYSSDRLLEVYRPIIYTLKATDGHRVDYQDHCRTASKNKYIKILLADDCSWWCQRRAGEPAHRQKTVGGGAPVQQSRRRRSSHRRRAGAVWRGADDWLNTEMRSVT